MGVVAASTEIAINTLIANDQLHSEIGRFGNGNVIHVFQTKQSDNVYWDVDARIFNATYLT